MLGTALVLLTGRTFDLPHLEPKSAMIRMRKGCEYVTTYCSVAPMVQDGDDLGEVEIFLLRQVSSSQIKSECETRAKTVRTYVETTDATLAPLVLERRKIACTHEELPVGNCPRGELRSHVWLQARESHVSRRRRRCASSDLRWVLVLVVVVVVSVTSNISIFVNFGAK